MNTAQNIVQTLAPAKRITVAHVKRFIDKHRDSGGLLIKVHAEFSGMTDGIEQNMHARFLAARPAEGCFENKRGVEGVWLVGHGGDRVQAFHEDGLIGFKVYNCCGWWTVAVVAGAA